MGPFAIAPREAPCEQHLNVEHYIVFGPSSRSRCEQFIDAPPEDCRGRALSLTLHHTGWYVTTLIVVDG